MPNPLTQQEQDFLTCHHLHADYMFLDCGPNWRDSGPARDAYFAARKSYAEKYGEEWKEDFAKAALLHERKMGRAAA